MPYFSTENSFIIHFHRLLLMNALSHSLSLLSGAICGSRIVLFYTCNTRVFLLTACIRLRFFMETRGNGCDKANMKRVLLGWPHLSIKCYNLPNKVAISWWPDCKSIVNRTIDICRASGKSAIHVPTVNGYLRANKTTE